MQLRRDESTTEADVNLCLIYYKTCPLESQGLFSMCYILGYSCLSTECVSAGEVIGAGPHISAFTVFGSPTAFLKMLFLTSEIKHGVKTKMVVLCVKCCMSRLRSYM